MGKRVRVVEQYTACIIENLALLGLKVQPIKGGFECTVTEEGFKETVEIEAKGIDEVLDVVLEPEDKEQFICNALSCGTKKNQLLKRMRQVEDNTRRRLRTKFGVVVKRTKNGFVWKDLYGGSGTIDSLDEIFDVARPADLKQKKKS